MRNAIGNRKILENVRIWVILQKNVFCFKIGNGGKFALECVSNEIIF